MQKFGIKSLVLMLSTAMALLLLNNVKAAALTNSQIALASTLPVAGAAGVAGVVYFVIKATLESSAEIIIKAISTSSETLEINGLLDKRANLTVDWDKSPNKQTVKGIIIPNYVKSIGKDAFSWCKNLQNVRFEKGSALIKIGANAFMGCGSLKQLEIPKSVVFIERYAFLNCVSLEQITIPPLVKFIGRCAFSACNGLKRLITSEEGALKEIGPRAFLQCASLEEITLPSSLELIGDRAFCGCGALGIVNIPENSNLRKIGEQAFEGNDSVIDYIKSHCPDCKIENQISDKILTLFCLLQIFEVIHDLFK